MINGEFWTFTISIGATQLQTGSEEDDLLSIIARADEALYEAKKAGRNRIVTKQNEKLAIFN